MSKLVSWTRNNWLGLVLLAIVLTAIITFGWWTYCCIYDGETGLAIACLSITVFFVPIATLYILTLGGRKINPDKELIVPASAIIALLGCFLGLSNSCNAANNEIPFLIKDFQYIIDNKDLNWDAIDINEEVVLCDTTYADGRHWSTVRYYVNNTDSSYYQIEIFEYEKTYVVNYIEYVTSDYKEICDAIKYCGTTTGFKKHKSSYIHKERELNNPFTEDYEESTLWHRVLKDRKHHSFLFTTL